VALRCLPTSWDIDSALMTALHFFDAAHCLAPFLGFRLLVGCSRSNHKLNSFDARCRNTAKAFGHGLPATALKNREAMTVYFSQHARGDPLQNKPVCFQRLDDFFRYVQPVFI